MVSTVESSNQINSNKRCQFSRLIQSLIENVSIETILLNDYLTFRKEIAENENKFSRMEHSFTIPVNQGLNLQQQRKGM
ncbi:hypothetical protein QR98_0087010 [Sarcoptes scabiei]|uniref:Uncharacterized protein n=1 Tax=Sarcoptes scabiei TaxID=52283 RepID=A0A132AGN3_SARSC|nr:hypothetical protein QR98_0087010 [Sarcoptes scabiei]